MSWRIERLLKEIYVLEVYGSVLVINSLSFVYRYVPTENPVIVTFPRSGVFVEVRPPDITAH